MNNKMSTYDYLKTFHSKQKRPKYNNKKITFDNIKFDSQKEYRRYLKLKELQEVNYISGLVCHPKYTFKGLKYKSGRTITYIGDFEYINTVTGLKVTEDCKGMKTAAYKIKWGLMKYILNIEVVEI